jgi:hypothetical protein
MAMKKTVLLWTCLLASVSVHAQSPDGVDPQNDINAIKRDTSYIYAETTMKDAVEAQSGARALLELKLYDWLRSRHPEVNSDSVVSGSKDQWFDLVARRGNYSRVFVYVDKRLLVPVAEEPEPEEMSEPVVDDPVSIMDDFLRLELTDDEETMSGIYRFNSIEPYIKGLKEAERLKAYGKYDSLPEDELCYLFVYNRDGDVVAVLRQTEDGSHFNLREKRDDNVRNYKNCGAIWFQLKKKQNY